LPYILEKSDKIMSQRNCSLSPIRMEKWILN